MPLLLSVGPFLVPVGIAFYLFWLAWRRAGDPQRSSAQVQYEPPDKLTPGECGALLDNAVAMRGISATIVDLSVRGYLAIERSIDAKGDAKSPGAQQGREYFFHMIKPPGDWGDLKPHESGILSAIFIPTNPLRMLMEAMSRMQNATSNPALRAAYARVQTVTAENPALRAMAETDDGPRTTVGLMEVRTHFNLHLGILRNAIFEALVAGGYYVRRPDQLRARYVASGILLGLLMVAIGGFLSFTATPWLAWILSGVLTAAVILGFGWLMPARSTTGALALTKVQGFADFLGRVEKDQIERLETSPQNFEKYLPYAMALGVEKTWAQSFASVALPAPQWYRGSGSEFLPVHLAEGMSNMIPNQQES